MKATGPEAPPEQIPEADCLEILEQPGVGTQDQETPQARVESPWESAR